MTPKEAFFTVHADLPREGPGLPADVLWALELAGVSAPARVLDAGCGPGADLEMLAEVLHEARIEGVDGVPGFVAQASARVARFGDRVRVFEGDMTALSGPYDFIWCAGALYFPGVTEGLRAWRGALAPGATVAFSEPVLTGPLQDAVMEFWAGYPEITNLEGITARVQAAGYEVLGHRMVKGAAWEAYYAPMEARIAGLKPATDPALAAAIEDAEREIALWRQAQGAIAYALLVVRPVDEAS